MAVLPLSYRVYFGRYLVPVWCKKHSRLVLGIRTFLLHEVMKSYSRGQIVELVCAFINCIYYKRLTSLEEVAANKRSSLVLKVTAKSGLVINFDA